ncbi:MAG: right-handed parallel beta-helix repeat-containing protein [Bacteroidia bacterium]|nr:right-handed parallel beta-helix repeat-containing protein [Bacteroidia bacterium]
MKNLLAWIPFLFILLSCQTGESQKDAEEASEQNQSVVQEEMESPVLMVPEIHTPEKIAFYSVSSIMDEISYHERLLESTVAGDPRVMVKNAIIEWKARLTGFTTKLHARQEIPIIQINTLEELQMNLGSNRCLLLRKKDFLIEDAPDEFLRPGILISRDSNLAIIGYENNTEVTYEVRNQPVISVSKSENISFRNLKAGHIEGAEWDCEGSGFVFEFDQCKKIRIENCAMYGSGVVGLVAEQTTNLFCLNSEIYDCSDHAILLQNSPSCTLSNCKIHDNLTWSPLIYLQGNSRLSLEACSIVDNNPNLEYQNEESREMFGICNHSSLEMWDCETERNGYETWSQEEEEMMGDFTRFRGSGREGVYYLQPLPED